MRLALYQPDIPQNTGTIMRFCACMGIGLDIIEPCGFVFDDKRVRRAGMDYIDFLDMKRHSSWESFQEEYKENRFVLLTTKTDKIFTEFKFEENDVLIAGRESAGVPEDVHNMVDNRVTIPMVEEARSINVAISCALVAGEALRQTNLFPSVTRL